MLHQINTGCEVRSLQRDDPRGFSPEWRAAFIQLVCGGGKKYYNHALTHRANASTSKQFWYVDTVFEGGQKEDRKPYQRIQSLFLSLDAVRKRCGVCAAPAESHQSKSLRMVVPVTKSRLFSLLFFVGLEGLSEHRAQRITIRCVETALPSCVEDGKPLVPWEGNPSIWSNNKWAVITWSSCL